MAVSEIAAFWRELQKTPDISCLQEYGCRSLAPLQLPGGGRSRGGPAGAPRRSLGRQRSQAAAAAARRDHQARALAAWPLHVSALLLPSYHCMLAMTAMLIIDQRSLVLHCREGAMVGVRCWVKRQGCMQAGRGGERRARGAAGAGQALQPLLALHRRQRGGRRARLRRAGGGVPSPCWARRDGLSSAPGLGCHATCLSPRARWLLSLVLL